MSKDNVTPLFSIEDFNEIDQCKDAQPMEFKDEKGNEIGITVMVLGSQSEIVTKWRNKKLNAQRRYEDQQTKRGKNADVKPIEEDLEFGTEFTSIRIVGWTGIEEEYSPKIALRWCSVNTEIVKQVMEFSEDLGNFKKNS